MLGGIQALQEACDFILSNFCGAIVFVNTEVAISWLESEKPTKMMNLLLPPWLDAEKKINAPDLMKVVRFFFAGENFQVGQGPYHQHTSPVIFWDKKHIVF